MSNDPAVFSFDLQESLYFERGQEVAEMLGVSLDPNISIQPFNEYVSIRGVIELQGEYIKLEEMNEDEEQSLQDVERNTMRFVEKVQDTEDGDVEFSHRFPVEISVPLTRVNDLDDITVNIDAFDYELPSNNHLLLRSTIKIYGINEDEATVSELKEMSSGKIQEVETPDEKTSEVSDSDERWNEENQAEADFEFDIKTTESVDEAGEADEKEEETELEDKTTGRFQFKKTQTLQQFLHKNTSENEQDTHVLEDLAFMEDQDDVSEQSDPQLYVEAQPVVNESESVSESSDADIVENLDYLSDMFRNDEEDQYTKMRLCIVQQDDTIETISQKYEIPALQIINKNRLSDADLSEGQLLYIPQPEK
ncbi:stage VI sporulation protein D [Virgibacillus sp. W0181]|uniref:stage VI sporulation protein D n=1 Tax=Virgibacillus sp. W0181 TaxID=3391581 RepID=UPI003F46BDDD